jgi:hypothetical protein
MAVDSFAMSAMGLLAVHTETVAPDEPHNITRLRHHLRLNLEPRETSRTVFSSAATSRAIAGSSVPDADAMMMIARR